jgi:hypothetical protein
MLKKWFLLFGAVLVLALGACSSDDDPKNIDPVKVDPSLPPVAELPSFGLDVELVDTEAEEAVLSLAGDALAVVMKKLGPFFSSEFDIMEPSGEPVQTESINISFNEKRIAEGVTLTGFVQGKGSAAEAIINDNIDALKPGDFADINLRAKIAVDCDNLRDGDLTITGKYYLLGDPINGKVEISETAKISGTVNLKGEAAFSVSDSSKNIGAKLLLTLDVQGIKTIDVTEDFEPPEGFNPFSTFRITVKVYDDANELKKEFTYKFDDIMNAAEGFI